MAKTLVAGLCQRTSGKSALSSFPLRPEDSSAYTAAVDYGLKTSWDAYSARQSVADAFALAV